jgi:hypothetical protein
MFTLTNLSILSGLLGAGLVALTGSLCAVGASGTSTAGPQLAHMVYFKLKDNSGNARAKLIAACKLQLSKHEGEVAFGVGTLAGDMVRDVNDRDWDVSLQIVFVNKAAHDKYQDHPRHEQFIAECKDNWEKVRVFDTYLSTAPDATASE